MPLTAPPLLEMYRRQARDAKELVESWREAPPDPAQFAREIDDVIAGAAVTWPPLIEKTYHREWERAVEAPLDQRTRSGEIMFDLWDAFADVLEPLRNL